MAGPTTEKRRKDYKSVAILRILNLALCLPIAILAVLCAGSGMNLKNKVVYAAIDAKGESSLYTTMYALSIALGAILFAQVVVAGICFYATWNVKAGYVGVALNVATTLFALLVGILAFVAMGSTNETATEVFKKGMEMYTDRTKVHKEVNFLDLFQTVNKCCGLDDKEDFIKQMKDHVPPGAKANGSTADHLYYRVKSKTGMKMYAEVEFETGLYQRYPLTCCKKIEVSNDGDRTASVHKDDLYCSAKTTNPKSASNRNKDPCKSKLDKVGNALLPNGILGLVSAILVGIQGALGLVAIMKGPKPKKGKKSERSTTKSGRTTSKKEAEQQQQQKQGGKSVTEKKPEESKQKTQKTPAPSTRKTPSTAPPPPVLSPAKKPTASQLNPTVGKSKK